jgi:hypothetical protein
MKKEDFIKTKIYEDVFNTRITDVYREGLFNIDEFIKKHEIGFMGEAKVIDHRECIFFPSFDAIIYKVSHDCGWWSGYIKLEDVNREWRDYQLSTLL